MKLSSTRNGSAACRKIVHPTCKIQTVSIHTTQNGDQITEAKDCYLCFPLLFCLSTDLLSSTFQSRVADVRKWCSLSDLIHRLCTSGSFPYWFKMQNIYLISKTELFVYMWKITFSKIFQPLGSIKTASKNQTSSLVLTSHLLKLRKNRKCNSQAYGKQWLDPEITSYGKHPALSGHCKS